ncbi:MAG: FecR domain-containing protein [Planctomycetota bacterium]
MTRNQLEPLLAAVCDNRATDEEFDQLGAMLRKSPDAQAEYLRYLDLHAALSDDALPSFKADWVDFPIGQPKRPQASMGPATAFRWIGLVVAASLLIATGAAILLSRSNESRNPGWASSMPVPVATMLLTHDCRWRGVDRVEGEHLQAGVASLQTGTAVMRFDGGAELAMVGPASVDLLTHGKVKIHFGDVVVRASDGAQGFVVITPTSEVVDLGTEFAVKVKRDGDTEVHVMEGEVSYRAISSGDEVAQVLGEGEGVAIKAKNQPRAVPMNSPRFADLVKRINPQPRDDLLQVYEGFHYSPGFLPLPESTTGKGWAGPWRKRTSEENRHNTPDPSPNEMEIVHGEMNVRWPIPGGRLGALRMPSAESGGTICYLRPLRTALRLDRDRVTFVSLMIRETQRREGKRPYERVRLTFRSSEDYDGRTISFGHRPGFQPVIQTGDGVFSISPLVLPPEETTLWIGKIVSREHGEDEIYFRVYGEDDELDYAEPATWHVVTRSLALDARLDLVLLSSSGKTVRFIDELRIGPTWRSVAPIVTTPR